MEATMMVLESTRERLKKLSALAPRLDEATDRFTQELKTIETELNALDLGVECTGHTAIDASDAEIEYNDDGEVVGRYRTGHYLGYGRLRNSWGLLVLTYRQELVDGHVHESTLEDTSLLLDCSRALRTASADHILTLLDQLYKQAEKKIENLEKVMDARKQVTT